MHRSGTSALTRTLNLLGASLLKNLIPAVPGVGNDRGVWESFDLVSIHDEILDSNGSSWHDWRVFNSEWYKTDLAETYKQQLLDLLRRDFSDSDLFVIKDPRICRLVPLWCDVIEELGVKPVPVILFRNPLEVAASLEARDQSAPAKSLLLWLRHVLDAEKMSRELPRAISSYDALLDDWRKVVAKIELAGELQFAPRSAAIDGEIEQFLSRELRHQTVSAKDLTKNPEVVDWVKTTFAVMERMASRGENRKGLDQLDRIREEFDKACDAFGSELSDTEVKISELRAKIELLAEEKAVVRRRIPEIQRDRQLLLASLETERTKSAEQTLTLAQLKQELEAYRIGAQGSPVVELIETRNGHNVIRHGNRVYGLNQNLGEVDVTVGLQALVERYGTDAVIVAETVDGARAQLDARESQDQIDALRGQFDAERETRVQLARQLRAIEEKLAAERRLAKEGRARVELVEGRDGHNIIRHGNLVYALNQSLGEVDVTAGPQALLKRYGADAVVVTETVDGARAQLEARASRGRIAALARQIEEMEQQLAAERRAAEEKRTQIELVEIRDGYNIIRHGHRVYALNQHLGEVDVTAGPEALLTRYGADGIIVAETVDGARAQLEARASRGQIAALQGQLDVERRVTELQAQQQAALTAQLDALARQLQGIERQLAAEQSAAEEKRSLIELVGTHEGFNIIRHGNRVYALSQNLAEVDVTAGPQALLERYGDRNVLVTESVDGAHAEVQTLMLRRQIVELQDHLDAERRARARSSQATWHAIGAQLKDVDLRVRESESDISRLKNAIDDLQRQLETGALQKLKKMISGH